MIDGLEELRMFCRKGKAQQCRLKQLMIGGVGDKLPNYSLCQPISFQSVGVRLYQVGLVSLNFKLSMSSGHPSST